MPHLSIKSTCTHSGKLLGALLFCGIASQTWAAVSNPVFTNDATTLTLQYSYTGTPKERQIYFDTDNKFTTGHTIGGLGADYILINSNLYRYTGTGGYNWAWAFVRQVSYYDTGSNVKWVVPRTALNWPASMRIIAKTLDPAQVSATLPLSFQTTLAGLARDPLKWPFASDSIWNMPIGSNAQYVPANLPAVPSNNVWSPMPQIENERIILRPEAPKTKIFYNPSAWTLGADRCTPTTTLLTTLPFPDEFIVGNTRFNNGAAILEPDGRTVAQSQPWTRCAHGAAATALVTFPPVDLYGDGISGSHGGSYMSALGGTIRVGELRPGGPPIRHALKIDVDTREAFAPCATKAECFRWPAKVADSDAVGYYGSLNPNAPKAMKMGVLLAIPPTVDIDHMGLETEPGRQLAWTMQNYGMYIVDSVGGPGYTFAVEDGSEGSVLAQFQQDYGHPMEQRVRDNTPWTRDFQRLITALWVVNNNSPTSIGGGGTPRQPLAPPLP
ncbi:MAG: hypothetical protein RL748_1997 [Pseudomonadota bacterium]